MNIEQTKTILEMTKKDAATLAALIARALDESHDRKVITLDIYTAASGKASVNAYATNRRMPSPVDASVVTQF